MTMKGAVIRLSLRESIDRLHEIMHGLDGPTGIEIDNLVLDELPTLHRALAAFEVETADLRLRRRAADKATPTNRTEGEL